MRRELYIKIGIPAECIQWGLIVALLATLPASVGSETVTLNTYYPAPYGIYTQMRTTGQTTLAESGAFVGVGSSPNASFPKYNLDVAGNAHFSSNVGIFQTPTNVGNQSTPALAVNGVVASNQYMYAAAASVACNTSGAANSACPGGQFATWTPGIRIEGNWFAPKTFIAAGYEWGEGGNPRQVYTQVFDGSAWDAQWVNADALIDTITTQYYCCSPTNP